MRKASPLVLLRRRRGLATAGHRFLRNIRLRQSRSGDNAHKSVPLFVTPYYEMDAMAPVPPEVPCAATSCVNARRAAAASAGQAIFDFIWFSFFEIVPSREDWPTSKKCYSSPGAFVYAKSAGSDPAACGETARRRQLALRPMPPAGKVRLSCAL
jgi:hypothetical protein